MKQRYIFAWLILPLCVSLHISSPMDMYKTSYAANDHLESVHDCGVCLENLSKPGHDIITLGCKQNSGKHAFHFACLLEWQKKQSDPTKTTCPLCRDLISVSEEPEYRVFATLQQRSDEAATLKEAHEFTEGCFNAFKFLDTLMTVCPCITSRN